VRRFLPQGATASVTMYRPPRKDQFGQRTGTETSYTLTQVYLAPLSSYERNTEQSEWTQEGFTAFIRQDPAGLDVRADDEAEIDGERYKVYGPVRPWFGYGIQFNLNRKVG
jgi:hypothetical protein